jgi:hypothetical protein
LELLCKPTVQLPPKSIDTWRIKSAKMIFLSKKLDGMLADKSSKFILHQRFQPQNNANTPSIEA